MANPAMEAKPARGAGFGACVDAWVADTNLQLSKIRTMTQLRTAPRNVDAREKMSPYIEAVEQLVSVAQEQTRQIHDHVRSGQMQRLRMKRLAARAAQYEARIHAIRARIPPEFAETFEAMLAAPPTPPASTSAAAPPGHEPASPAPPSAPATPSPPRTPPPPRTGSLEFPLVAMVTEEELDDAPQYVKGRLTLKKIEDVVEKLNEFIIGKYTVVRKGRRGVAGEEKKKWEAFHDMQCPEGEGETYITDAEIKKLSSIKLNPTVTQAINVLRHIGAIKEVRGKNKIRIFIVRDPDTQ